MKSKLRIVFMGSPDFAVASLDRLVSDNLNVVAVVTGPDKRRGRGKDLSPTRVKIAANHYKIPVIEVEDLKSDVFEYQLRALKADLFVVVAFRVLPKNILQIPSIGSVNLHASLLPKYRGAAPIHRAVMNGEHTTGATVFFLDERVDTGNYIKQRSTSIGENETTGELYSRLMHMGAELLSESVALIQDESFQVHPQNHEWATSAPKLFSSDCKIDFTKPSSQVHNQIRGLSPFPTAFTFVDGKRLKVFESLVGPQIKLSDYRLHFVDDRLLVQCEGESTVELRNVQIEGKKATSGESFFHGYHGKGLITDK